ncbi:hypothetical protein GCM10027200_70110 [Lentzea nigeriaca]
MLVPRHTALVSSKQTELGELQSAAEPVSQQRANPIRCWLSCPPAPRHARGGRRAQPNEGFTGIEDSLNRTAWAYTRGGN